MNLKRVFRTHNVTQKEIAQRLNINPVSLSITLHNADNIKLSTLRRIADAVPCNIVEFFADEASEPVHTTSPTDCINTRTHNVADRPSVASVRPSVPTASIICPHCHTPFDVSVTPSPPPTE